MRISYAIVFVSDMARAVSFYRDCVGLPLRFESPSWSEFATGGATLALHHAGGTADRGEREIAGRRRPGFSVPDLDACHRRMTGQEVRCLQEPTTVFGKRSRNTPIRIAWLSRSAKTLAGC